MNRGFDTPICPFISDEHNYFGAIREIENFTNIELGNVRSIMIENHPYFFLRDVCNILEMTSTSIAADTKKVFDKMDPYMDFTHRGVPANYMPYYYMIDTTVQTGVRTDGSPALQSVKTMVISEPALYYFIMRSNKPKAIQFQNWVYNEILPSMRMAPSASKEVLDAIAEFREGVSHIADNLNSMVEQNSQLNQQLGFANGYAQSAANSVNLFAIGQQDMIAQLINSNIDLVNKLNNFDQRLEMVYNLGYEKGRRFN